MAAIHPGAANYSPVGAETPGARSQSLPNAISDRPSISGVVRQVGGGLLDWAVALYRCKLSIGSIIKSFAGAQIYGWPADIYRYIEDARTNAARFPPCVSQARIRF